MERQDIAQKMGAVAKEILGDPTYTEHNGTVWRFGSRGSMKIDLTKGTFFDHEAGVGGGVLDFIAHTGGGNRQGALQWLNGTFPGEVPPVAPVSAKSREARTREQSNLKAYALDLWRECRPATGTLVERYLSGRHVRFGAKLQDIRYHPSAPFGRDSGGGLVKKPCMVALVREPASGDPIGVHRTALTNTAQKIGRKMLGPTYGGVVMLSHGEIEGDIAVAEGIETALSAAKIFGRPVWAALSSGSLSTFAPLGGFRGLTIFADYDEAGVESAQGCARLWEAEQLPVVIQSPVKEGFDWNDWLRASERGEVKA